MCHRFVKKYPTVHEIYVSDLQYLIKTQVRVWVSSSSPFQEKKEKPVHTFLNTRVPKPKVLTGKRIWAIAHLNIISVV